MQKRKCWICKKYFNEIEGWVIGGTAIIKKKLYQKIDICSVDCNCVLADYEFGYKEFNELKIKEEDTREIFSVPVRNLEELTNYECYRYGLKDALKIQNIDYQFIENWDGDIN